jgi:DUF4097 and DUF4098 domain-containing protein YvlB
MRSLLFRVSAVVALLFFASASEAFAQDYQKSYRLNAGDTVRVRNVSGDVNITGYEGDSVTVSAFKEGRDRAQVEVAGEINASTASGNMSVRNVSGTVSAQSASGNVRVEIARLEGDGDMKFATASGDVDVRLPASLDANVKLSTMSGTVKTNFPLEVKERQHGPGSTAEGQLGSGARRLHITSASGDVSLNSQ